MHLRLILITVVTSLLNFACASSNKTNTTGTTNGQISGNIVQDNKTQCAHGQDIRWLELRGKERGCELSYTKHGQAAIVSTAHHGRGYCQQTMERIKGNLQTAGYTCN